MPQPMQQQEQRPTQQIPDASALRFPTLSRGVREAILNGVYHPWHKPLKLYIACGDESAKDYADYADTLGHRYGVRVTNDFGTVINQESIYGPTRIDFQARFAHEREVNILRSDILLFVQSAEWYKGPDYKPFVEYGFAIAAQNISHICTIGDRPTCFHHEFKDAGEKPNDKRRLQHFDCISDFEAWLCRRQVAYSNGYEPKGSHSQAVASINYGPKYGPKENEIGTNHAN